LSPTAPAAPIGVFDSGVGGLSILRALRAELPAEDFVYLADSGFAPYGERDEEFVVERALAVAQRLRNEHAIKALVIACNTATAAAVHLLREELPGLPIVGLEPALKPALAITRTGRIGVLATRATLASAPRLRPKTRANDWHGPDGRVRAPARIRRPPAVPIPATGRARHCHLATANPTASSCA